MESLNQHLECLKLFGDETEGQILESLNGILLALAENRQRSSSLLTDTGIFPTLAQILKGNPSCAVKAAQVIAEIAKNEEMKKPCIDAGLVLALVPLLESTDQEMLLHAGRAIGRICYENSDLQEQLVETGVITSLVRILTDYPDSEPLVHVNLLALCNLANLDALKVQMVEAGVHEALSEILLRLQGSSQAEDMCSVKAASNLIVSLLLGDESMQKMFANGCGIIYQKVGTWLASNHPQLQLTGALAVANFARNDGNCVRMVQLGVVLQLLDLLEQHVDNGDVSVQHAALSALRNLAIPVANKVQMLEEGVAERIQMLLRSEMAPVQFKLLGTLRMLIDGQADTAEMLGQDPLLINRLVQWCDAQEHAGVRGEANRLLASLVRYSRSQEVVKAIQQAQGVKHLVSMTTSEHVIMQNEALIALAIASAIHLEIIKDSLKESRLVQSLHKLLQDECTGPEVKYNSMGLLCSLLNSGDLKQEVEEDNIKETLEKLSSHSNANVVKQAVMTLQILRDESQNTGFVSP
ncbi:rap1 GTPase-GDP dissociation stimulator 1-like isoform X3 [Gopherus evgoodei]|uniref:rap1 GTPase-GDP dissociation stimulator 1-like isoform X3 n=1 Tax=Gopherus evgoodei TaxID=1825980 RepID=UPI0011CF6191|nr:rap1 GTPase-GDP dissociation stimulator 1-like isoform X3 [Gopherus evgoodei]